MFKSKDEIKKHYLSHLDSVRRSGLGHETSEREIYEAMLTTLREFDQNKESVPWNVLTYGL